MELSAHVGSRRRQLRLTQEEVSERLRQRGVERAASTIAHWEAGRQAIPLEILPDLAAALEEEVVVLYELAGILDRIPGGEIAKLLKGAKEEDIETVERLVKALLQNE